MPFRLGLFVLAFALCAPVAFGQMPQPDSSKLLSSSEVSETQVQQAARIATAIQMTMQKEQMKMRKKMKKKYGNAKEMDSTQKKMARKEMRKMQMKMRKMQMQMMQKKAEEEGMNPKMFQQIMQSTREDSTLKTRIQKAMKAQMQKQQPGG